MSDAAAYVPPEPGSPEFLRALETPECQAWMRTPAWRPWMEEQIRRCRHVLLADRIDEMATDYTMPPGPERDAKRRRALARVRAGVAARRAARGRPEAAA